MTFTDGTGQDMFTGLVATCEMTLSLPGFVHVSQPVLPT